MPRKQSVLYDKLAHELCKNRYDGYACDRCEYKLPDMNLMNLSLKQLISLIYSIMTCDRSENIIIDPQSILISCRGAITYIEKHTSSNVKLSTNVELGKCMIRMWLSVSPFAQCPEVVSIINSFMSTVYRCSTHNQLINNVYFIVTNYDTWSIGSIYSCQSNFATNSPAV